MDKKPFVIGIAGYGVVASGLCRLLQDNEGLAFRRAGRKIEVRKILVRDKQKQRSVPLPRGAELTTNLDELINDPEIEVVIELMGGVEAAKELVIKALENGKHVVTANKALLAEYGLELFKLAREKRRIFRYEASVAGAVPVVSIFKESLTGSYARCLTGILNGTSNYILSEMSVNNIDFNFALKQAQELGFAEADPSLDIDGMDAAHKLIILIRLAFGMDYPLAQLYVKGIRGLSTLDIRFAREFGYRIKLVGMVRANTEGDGKRKIVAGVFTALIPYSLMLARVDGSFNAVAVTTEASGPLFFHGKGAGSLPTAGAVMADIIAVAREEIPNNTGFADENLPKATILPYEDWHSCFYIRLMVKDEPGVLRDISGCLAKEGISVAQMIQKSDKDAIGVPLVFMTHETSEKALLKALQHARKMNFLCDDPVYFRALEKEY